MCVIGKWDSALMVKLCGFFSPKKIVTVILYLGLHILKAPDYDLTLKVVFKPGDRPQFSGVQVKTREWSHLMQEGLRMGMSCL